jgi:tetratricopeptide (TPR) repeat protein
MAANGAPDPAQARDLSEFIAVLAELRQWAGGPSFRVLAKRVGPLLRPPQVIAHTTVSAVFQPHRRRLDIDLVTAVVRALGVDEPEVMRWRKACVQAHVKVKTGGPVGAFRQLPADVATFTGRDAELKHLLDIAADAAHGATTVVISAIDGMAGIGKTALAVHAGHVLAEKFPDGQLFVDLHAHSADAGPRDPNEVLSELLQALGSEPRAIPPDLEARAKAFRNRLAGSRTLILLDDAASEQQVRPLFPAAPGCLVLVTSRNRLKALDDAHPLPLDVLDPADAIVLLRRHIGPGRIAADDPAVARIAELCGYLPLALRITAANLAHRRSWTTGYMEARLRTGLAGLAAFDDGDRQVRAAFDLSYNALTSEQQAAFRHLGLIPGSDGDVYAAAALLDTGVNEADALLQDLTDRSLLIETAPGRYRLHDLLREYARTLVVTHDPDARRQAALDRLLHYYAHTAQTASGPIARWPRPAPDDPAPAHAPDLTDPETARAWLRTERPNLDAAYTHAHTHHLDRHTTALAAGMTEILLSDGPWPRALQINQGAETAARRDNPAAHAAALTDLGRVRHLVGDHQGAAEPQTRALEIFRQIGDRPGEALARYELGRIRILAGDLSGAQDAQTQALEILQQIGNRPGEACALTELARVRYLVGDLPAAEDDLLRALGISREIGNGLGEAGVLTGLGLVREATGDHAGAEDAQIRALEIYQQLGDLPGEANVLNNLGRVRTLTGDLTGAQDFQARGLEIYQQLGNRAGEANILSHLGRVRTLTGDYAGAQDALTRALEIYQQHGNRPGEANVLTYLGRVRHMTGDYPGAQDALTRALEIVQRDGARGNEAQALNFYAATIAALGDHPRALTLYQQALAINRELRAPDQEAISLEGIADHHVATGDPALGVEYLNQALEIYRRLGMRADIERVLARLFELDVE